ncbi:hypothetical protein [Peribacillus kribbensis]|uniref:hypothetical protein n=1 Tax=Peribacillus kribbensis TaxID=356658 RepID=UPI00040F08AF|nr:hypothetical protein [Peribacillus kribbensis]
MVGSLRNGLENTSQDQNEGCFTGKWFREGVLKPKLRLMHWGMVQRGRFKTKMEAAPLGNGTERAFQDQNGGCSTGKWYREGVSRPKLLPLHWESVQRRRLRTKTEAAPLENGSEKESQDQNSGRSVGKWFREGISRPKLRALRWKMVQRGHLKTKTVGAPLENGSEKASQDHNGGCSACKWFRENVSRPKLRVLRPETVQSKRLKTITKVQTPCNGSEKDTMGEVTPFFL